jgi:hypothetical protein
MAGVREVRSQPAKGAFSENVDHVDCEEIWKSVSWMRSWARRLAARTSQRSAVVAPSASRRCAVLAVFRYMVQVNVRSPRARASRPIQRRNGIMNDPKIASEIVRRIDQRLQIKDVEASLLDQADKCDPLNERAVLAVEALVDGKQCGWVIQTRNNHRGDRDELVSRLVDGAVEEIIAKPNQDVTSPAANRPVLV